MEKRKKRFWSLMLSVALIVGLLWAVPGNAAQTLPDDKSGTVTITEETIWDSGFVTIGGYDYILSDDISELIVKNELNIKGNIDVGNADMTVNATTGTINIKDTSVFNCSSYKGTLNNYQGSVTCDSFEGNLINSGSFYVKNSFDNASSDETIGTVEVGGPTTIIRSAGGEFELKYGSRSTYLTGKIEETEAWTLFDPDSSLAPVALTITPSDGDEMYEVSGKKYFKNSFNITPPDGYAVGFDKDSCDRNYITVDKEKLESFNSDTRLCVVKLADYSYNYENLKEAGIDFENIVFDNKPPTASVSFIADGKTIATPSEGQEIEARKLSIEITAEDDNLADIIQGEGTNATPITVTGSPCTTTLNYTAGKTETKSCYYQVYDYSGNEISLGFKLTYAKADYGATIYMNDVYYGRTLPKPTISSDNGSWDGDITYEYSSDGGSTYSGNEPKAQGDYKVKAILTGSTTYNDDEATADFKILGYEPTITVSVSPQNVKVGQAYGAVIEKPEDWITTGGNESLIVTEFKATGASDDAYSTDYPTLPGTYMVRVTMPATDKYKKTTAVGKNSYTIEKGDVSQAILTMSDIEVGGLFAPALAKDSDYDGTVTYKCKPATQTEYTDSDTINLNDAISEAGEYTAIAILNESQRYNATQSNEVSFTVTKKTVSLSVGLEYDELKVGEALTINLSPAFNPALDVSVVYEFKGKEESDSAYTTTPPSTPGEYVLRATITGSKIYEDASAKTSFTIVKIDENTAMVRVPDTIEGTDYEPELSTLSDGADRVKYEYKLETEDDSTYSETKPTEPGTYIIRATIPETDNFKEQVCTSTFNITATQQSEDDKSEDEKNEDEKQEDKDGEEGKSGEESKDGKEETSLQTAKAKVEIPDIYVGTSYEPLLTTDSDGKANAVFEYKSADDKDAEYSSEKPTKSGKYIVRATVPETSKYQKVVCEATFTISKINAKDSKVKIKDVTIGNTYSPVLTTDSDGRNDAVYEYKKASESADKYSDKKPTKPGEYSVRATIPETDKYLKVVCENTFKIVKKIPTAEIKLDDQHVGVKYKPTLATNSDGKSKAHFEYKNKDASDDTYSKTKPTKEGEYVVRATVPETDEYQKLTCEKGFSITYLRDGKTTYRLKGNNGKNGYYVSDVYIEAPKGFEISTEENGIYSLRIKYTEDITKVYLRRKSDGAKSGEVEVNQEIKIDKDAPQMVNAVDDNNKTVDMTKTDELYADKITLSFTDENIESVKVNGQSLTPEDNKVTIVLDPDGGDKYFAIIIEDIAGNRYSENFVIKAAWMRDNILPSGSKVRLSKGNGYKLNGGSRKVDGDSTVYSGGRVIYVNASGEYIFVEQ